MLIHTAHAPQDALPPRRLIRGATLGELIEAIGPEAVTEAATLFRASAAERVAGTLDALATGDLAAASRHAHALKSPAAMLGADDLAQAMATIERAALSRDRIGAQAVATTLRALMEASLAELDATLAEAG